MNAKDQEGTFWDNSQHIDDACGYTRVYTCQNSLNCKFKMGTL